MAKLFISYSRVDKGFVKALVDRLRRMYDPGDIWYDDGLHGGDLWWEEILDQIAKADIFIYVLSNESVQSDYCQAEFTEARRLQKGIITVQARDRTKLTDRLKDIHYIDMTSGVTDGDALTDLYRSIDKQTRNLRRRRPLWAGRTPKPGSVEEKPRPADAAEVETPTLEVPSAERNAPPAGKWYVNPTIVGGLFVLAAAVVTGMFGLWQGVFTNVDDTPPLPAVTMVGTPFSASATATGTPDATVVADAIREADAELTALAATDTPSPSASPTTTPSATLTVTPTATAAPMSAADATLTAIVLNLEIATVTEVARLAITETAVAMASIEAGETATQRAVETEVERGLRNATATQYAVETDVVERLATLVTWTPTPTATNTPTPTPDPVDLAQTPVARNADWTPVERDFDGVTMVLVPEGCFMMGSENADSDETPAHEQCFDEPFWIDKYEVTNGQYGSSGRWSGDDLPRETVSWFDAVEHCEGRSARLPTEREWEYAARGPDNLVYPWGNEWNPDNANWRQTSPDETFPVGNFPDGVSWAGAYDMSGNVWEWVSTIYGVDQDFDYNFNEANERLFPYPYVKDDGREQNSDNRTDVRVLRGGSFLFTSFNLRSANRGARNPDDSLSLLGFRCVRSTEITTLASNFSGGNTDWTPQTQTFPDDPTGAEMITLASNFSGGNTDRTPQTQTFPDNPTGAEIITLASNFNGGNTDWTPQTQTFPDDPTSAEMVVVPVGSFEMGSTSEEIEFAFEMCQQAADNGAECPRSLIEDEAPNGDNTQTVIAPFWIDRTEVTRAQYQQCVDAGACEETPGNIYSTEPDQPINRVTWFQAVTYCEWRGDDYRLPTEAEWEYAARGPDRWLFPWGDAFSGNEANHCDGNCGLQDWASDYNSVNEENDDGYAVTAPVASYDSGQSWVGAYDMAGNVWEWTSSPSEDYPYSVDTDSNTTDTSRLRVLRGGSFLNSTGFLRSADRIGINPDLDGINNGFRCARPTEIITLVSNSSGGNTDSTPQPRTFLDDPAGAEIITLASNFSGGNTDWTPQPWIFDDDPAGAEMVVVPVGSFEMGSTEDEITTAVELCNAARRDGNTCHRSFFEDEVPRGDNTQTFTEPFWIDRTEVTRAQYQQCVDAGVCEETPSSIQSTEPDQPITLVTWFQAETYCEWRGDNYRLPTEAEWEYAARGPDRWLFTWVNDFTGDEVNYCDSNCAERFVSGFTHQKLENDDGYVISSPVGSYESRQSWVGAYDMAGNVGEWTSSIYENYPYSPAYESNVNDTSPRVLRGGAVLDTVEQWRSANRGSRSPSTSNSYLGFRCARS